MSMPFEWLAVKTGDLNAPQSGNPSFGLRHQVEYCWGLNKNELNEHSAPNCVKLHSSMKVLERKWMLVPTRETLKAMLEMQQFNLSCPLNQRKHYLWEFSPKEYEYMFIPTRELPELVITMPNRKIVPLTISQGMFPLFTSSVNPWAVCHRAKTNILLCDIAIRGSDWALDLFCLTDIWRLCPPPAFLDEGPGPQGDCRRNEISTDEDAIQMVESRYGAKYSKFLLWLYACADTDWETDISIKDWDEGDEEKFFHTARQQPAWFSESVKGRMMRKWGWGVTFT